eukprot:6376653-Amphidinium_carterae.1
MPVLHLCSVSGVCSFDVPGRVVLHCPCWRLRNPLTANEGWFVQTRPERAGGLVGQPAGLQTPQEVAHVSGPANADHDLLQRFEELRETTARPESDERALGRQEVAAALKASEENLEAMAKKRKAT